MRMKESNLMPGSSHFVSVSPHRMGQNTEKFKKHSVRHAIMLAATTNIKEAFNMEMCSGKKGDGEGAMLLEI